MMGEDSIIREIAAVLGEMTGRDDVAEIGPDTRFFADLGLASIDAVVLGESLERHYGMPIPFSEMMAELGARADRDFEVGELAAFLRRYVDR